jgi:hypothetical protein
VATTWGGSLDTLVEEYALGRGEAAVASSDLDQDEDGSYRYEKYFLCVIMRHVVNVGGKRVGGMLQYLLRTPSNKSSIRVVGFKQDGNVIHRI